MSELRKKPRYQVSVKQQGTFKGKVWVRKAGMFLEYAYFNDPKQPDIFNWI